MNNRGQEYRVFISLIMAVAVIIPSPVFSCTIFSAKDKHGRMWAGNNEDFYWFDFSTQIRIVPKTDSTFSFIYFNYNNLDFPQGGVNGAGLFYDANMVEASDVEGQNKKSNFPGETRELMLNVLRHCKTVPEALLLFDKYYIPELRTGQIHLADKEGNMGIITIDRSWLTSDHFQVSTNYNLSHQDDDYKKCWRYPIAYSMLRVADASLELMTAICDSTCQRKGVSTIYSNVHNLTSGEMWFYYGWDYDSPYKTTFEEMIALGDTTIMMRELFADQIVVKAYNAFAAGGFDAGLKILNTVGDARVKEEKLKLFLQGVLFDFESFIKSEKISVTKNEQLVRQVIEASNNEDLLYIIANQNISKTNKKLAEQKLRTIQTSGISVGLISGVVLGGSSVVLLVFVLKNRKKGKLAVP